MSWSKSISLDVANKLFEVIGVSFEQNELEGGYIAKHESKTLRRPTLTRISHKRCGRYYPNLYPA